MMTRTGAGLRPKAIKASTLIRVASLASSKENLAYSKTHGLGGLEDSVDPSVNESLLAGRLHGRGGRTDSADGRLSRHSRSGGRASRGSISGINQILGVPGGELESLAATLTLANAAQKIQRQQHGSKKVTVRKATTQSNQLSTGLESPSKA